MTSPSSQPSPSTDPTGFSTALITSTPAAEPTNTFASTGGPLDLRGPWTSTPDPRGDANPAIDITEVGFANVGKYATTRLNIAHLNWTGSFHVFLSRGSEEDGYVVVNVIPHLNHTITVQAGGGSRSGDFSALRCPGLATRYDVTLKEVLIQVPWSCIRPQEDPTVSFDPGTSMSGAFRVEDDRVDFPTDASGLIPHTP